MNQSLFDSLAKSRIVRRFEESFPAATGCMVKLLPAVETEHLSPIGASANPFCHLMSRSPEGRNFCNKTFISIQKKASEDLALAQCCCFAGFTHFAIPVISGGAHIATIYGGQMRLEKPSKRAFEKIARQLIRLGLGEHLTLLEHAWLHTPVVSEKELEAFLFLLDDFAARIAKHAAGRILEGAESEPSAVTRARRFIQERFAEPITMPDTARHLHMSPSTLSKMFKNTLGLTFTQYLNRLRVEKSKIMLVQPTVPIRTIAFQTGFESISQFNRCFRQYAEMSPTEYRASLSFARSV
jgi:AraC-like DNA-binding protein/ligand-binding sensor protein